ncbi:MAG: hypothetical protein JKX85_05530 [Phycisphaeraceae bacterium]|nr:hypothetical protein [Phycisphaeraceae bacterium]
MPTTDLDQLMDRASLMLVKMQYVEAQKLCEQALRIAYDCKQWSYFARIILPLQECSRQLRMIAVEGSIVLGTDQLSDDVIATLNELQSGCVVFTGPDAATQALKLIHQVQQQSHHLLILSAITGENHWTVHSAHHPILTVSFPAPPKAWQN